MNGRKRELDGLRGVAVLIVVLYHWEVPLISKGGWLGVDLFFVLSGYLITAILLRERTETDTISLLSFWSRRAVRILPAVAVFGVTMVILGQLTLSHTPFTPGAAFAATMLELANWARALNPGDINMGPLSHTWSLSIEEQFYLLWPPVLILISRRGTRLTMIATGVVALFAIALRLGLAAATSDMGMLYYSSFTRVGGLLIGCFVAALAADGRLRPTRWLGAGAVASFLIVILGSLVLERSRLNLSVGVTVFDLAAACVLVALITDSAPLLSRVLTFSPIRSLGLVSYGVYLWHKGLFVLLDDDGMDPARYVVLVVATVACTWASWRWIEQPLLRRRRDRTSTELPEPLPAVEPAPAPAAGAA